MKISTVSILDFVVFKDSYGKEDRKFMAHCCQPFQNLDEAKNYALIVLEEEGYSIDNIIEDHLSESKFWGKHQLLGSYILRSYSHEEAEEDGYAKDYIRYEGYRLMGGGMAAEMYKNIIVLIQTEEI